MKFALVKGLYRDLIRQSKFPKENLQSYTFRYGAVVLFCLLSLQISLTLDPSNGKTVSYLLFSLAIFLTALTGDLKTSLITIIFGTVSIIFLFYPLKFPLNLFSVLEISIFILLGVTISYITARLKQLSLLSEFNKLEKASQNRIKNLEGENLKAKKEIKVRDEFLSIASHELKTPLTTTLLKLQTALHNIRNVSLASFSVQNLLDMLESAEQQTQRLSRMINDLLNVSLITTGRMSLDLEESDLSQLTKDVIKRFAEKSEKENIEIRIDTNGVVKGKFDPLRIEQVLMNLISNALKYGQGKPIEVRVFKQNATGKIIVKDHGIGIPSREKAKIFELFERAVHDNHYKGLGVGLYITNQVIKAHGGKISVDSKEGQGSTFTVELPLKKMKD